MGQKETSRMRVATLNYSGIFVSPFEFYAMDNWQELEHLGRVFQENLKNDYQAIKNQIKAVAPNMAPAEDFYTRRRFEWRIEDFDKKYKGKRSSPVYIKDTVPTADLVIYNYMGIGKDNTLLDQVLFKEEWASKNQRLYSQWLQQSVKEAQKKEKAQEEKRKKEKTQKEKAQQKKKIKEKVDFELYMCRRFDFQCYQAIIMYLFNLPQHAHFFFKGERRLNEGMKLDDIVNGINMLQPEERTEAIEVYRKYMAHQFQRIDSPLKIKMTADYMFNKWDLDVICLQEVDVKLRNKLLEQEKYFVIAPVDEENDDQCVILLKRKLSLVPSQFAKRYQVMQVAHSAFNDFKSLQKQRDDLVKVVQVNCKDTVAKRIIEKITQQVRSEDFKQYKKATLQKIFSELMNPKKGDFDSWMEKYQDAFLQYGQQQAKKESDKDKKVIEKYLDELKLKGLLFWKEAFIFTYFDSGQNLQGQSNSGQNLQGQSNSGQNIKGQSNSGQPYIFGSVHLSSKTSKNKLQVQLLGIFIYELLDRNYKIVIGGDFNSHIVIGKKQKTEDLFAFVREFLEGNKDGLQKLNKIEKTLYIFPKHPLILTTKKKRTIMQVQAKKTNLLAEKSIDQIISNIPILLDQCYTGDVEGLGSGKNNNKAFIPHMKHPYDHFIVEAVLDTSQQHP